MRRRSSGLFQRIRNAFLFSNRIQAQNAALNIWERTLQKTILRSTPLIGQVEVTNRCNLHCVFCSRHEHQLNFGDLSPDLLPKVITLSPKSRELILFGYGEPLISEAFYTLLRKSRSGRLSFATNGLLLTRELISQIIQESGSPIHNVTFSIDGIHPHTYSSLRENSNFDKVWNNLESLSKYKSCHKLIWPEIWINFVAMKRNLEELPQLVEKAAQMGVSQINIFHLIVWNKSYKNESLIYYPELTKQIFKETHRKAQELGIRVDLPVEISQNHKSPRAKFQNFHIPKCYQPWSYTYIRYDGIVQACCFSDKLIMGNLAEKSFEEIWNDKPYQKLRATINRTPPIDCQRCELKFRYIPSPNDFETYIKLQPRMR